MVWTWLLVIILFQGLQSHPYGSIILKELLETWENSQVFIYVEETPKESTETTAWAGTLLTPQLVLTSLACCVTNLKELRKEYRKLYQEPNVSEDTFDQSMNINRRNGGKEVT